MKLYRRFAEVTFSGSGALAIRDLRIAFKVDKTVSGKPNVSVIEIWNLSATHRGQIKQEFDRLRLKAGYLGGEGEGGNVGVIFDGFIREVTHARKGTDIVTRIEAGDGDKASREGTVSVTLPAGTTPRQVVEVLIDHMPGVETGALGSVWMGFQPRHGRLSCRGR